MPRKPLSHEEHLEKRRRFRRRQDRIRLGLIAFGLVAVGVNLIPRHSSIRWVSLVVFAALVVYALAAVTYEVIAGTSYFREKYRQGYKVGPYADIPRKSAPVERELGG
jgi:hypothetical protein